MPPKKRRTKKALDAYDLARNILYTVEGQESLTLLVKATVAGDPDLSTRALVNLMQYAIRPLSKRATPKKQPQALAPVAMKAPKLTPEEIEAQEARIPASELISRTSPPANPEQVAEEYAAQVLKPQFLKGQRAWSFPPRWKGKPLTTVHADWERALRRAGIDSGNLLIQVLGPNLVMRLDGFNGLGRT